MILNIFVNQDSRSDQWLYLFEASLLVVSWKRRKSCSLLLPDLKSINEIFDQRWRNISPHFLIIIIFQILASNQSAHLPFLSTS